MKCNTDSKKQIPSEVTLTEKGRNRALDEFIDHQIKAEGFLMLAGRYKLLGLEIHADSYNEQARMETATTRGFQAVIKAYDRKLEDLGIRRITREESVSTNQNRRNLQYADLEAGSQNSDPSKFYRHTEEVRKVEETLQKLEVKLAAGGLTPLEKKQFGEAVDRRERGMWRAEKEAFSIAASRIHPQLENQTAEKIGDMPGRSGSNNPAKSRRRMNRLATGVIISQTLKVLDHEL